MTPEQIKEQAVETIYLFPGEHEGETCLLWGDDPAPGEGMDASEAVEYVRKDVHDARIAEFEQAEKLQIQLREKMQGERDALAAHVERLTEDMRELIDKSEGVAGLHLNGDLAPWDELTQGGRFEGWLMSLDEAPAHSLARRDALKQAEALELLYDQSSRQVTIARGVLLDRARNLRQQAEAQQ